MQQVYCDSCKTESDVSEVKVLKEIHVPEGPFNKSFEFAIFECPACGEESGSSLRTGRVREL